MSKRYGQAPWHLLGHVALFALTAYAITQIFTLGAAWDVVVWMIAAVLLHDAILWPIYSTTLGPLSNHLRIPLGLSLLLGLVFIGTISGKGNNAYRNASGETYDGYVTRWLAVSAALFAISAVAYFVRRRRNLAAPSAVSSTTPSS